MENRKKILVVDDAIGIRTFLKIALENLGYSVIESRDGESAIKRFEQDGPDVVILDLGLPDIDGIEVLQKIRRQNKEVLIIILTVRSEESSIREAFQKGANSYITKPFQIDEILETLEIFQN